MNQNKVILAVAGSFIVGVVSGFALGYSFFKSKEGHSAVNSPTNQNEPVHKTETKTEDKKVEVTKTINPDSPTLYYDPSKIVSDGPAKLATEDKDGVDYTDYTKKVEALKYNAESEAPTDGDDLELTEEEDPEIEEKMETFGERTLREQKMINDELDKFTQENGNKIQILGNHPLDPNWPDIHYEEETLFYFIPDEVLTDDFGNIIGNREEVVGENLTKWYHNSHEYIWVRNNIENKDYKIIKIDDDYANYWNKMVIEE